MKQALIFIFTLSLLGCAGDDIVTLPDNHPQANDLRDLDRDGVIEAREQCDDTLTGALINNYGCSDAREISKRIKLNVLFANNSSYVQPRFYTDIESLAEFMESYPGTSVVIEGHASALGAAAANQTLSQSRAEAIARVLTGTFGIAKSRVSAKGYGESRLLDESDTPEAHAKNRRVVADISGSNTSTNMKWTIYSVDDET
ncbi:OmpA family protein [Parasalinivibrio latis]|uniref:OmpA family protein n=1 Tax=Parasalinivibrio latis TaxID=2952610 RepID=UPI0030E1FBBD